MIEQRRSPLGVGPTTNELVAAHKAGIAYERRNRPQCPISDLATVARSTGWHGDLEIAWLAGAAGERKRHREHEARGAVRS
jgi:hypothetical protein